MRTCVESRLDVGIDSLGRKQFLKNFPGKLLEYFQFCQSSRCYSTLDTANFTLYLGNVSPIPCTTANAARNCLLVSGRTKI